MDGEAPTTQATQCHLYADVGGHRPQVLTVMSATSAPGRGCCVAQLLHQMNVSPFVYSYINPLNTTVRTFEHDGGAISTTVLTLAIMEWSLT